jgi:acetolactate synthase-1/2/3 large subunit
MRPCLTRLDPRARLLRTGGEILVANLLAQDATHAFAVPGESHRRSDALHDARDRLALIVCRQERRGLHGGGVRQADGAPWHCIRHARSRGTNASIGVHAAAQDSSPMILFVGQVGGDMVDREAFQEIDYRRMFGGVAKWAAQIDRAERIPEYVARAYRTAMSGRPGPVVLALPEDMLSARAECADVPRVHPVAASPDPAQVDAVAERLVAAKRPLVLVGGSRWDSDACRSLLAVAEKFTLPVACGFRNQDLFDNRHVLYAGDVGIGVNPRLAVRVRDADVLLVIGERLGEMTTSGYTLLAPPVPSQTLIHVHPGADELGRVYQPAIAIASTPGAFLAELARSPRRRGGNVEGAHAEYLAWQAPRPVPGSLDLWEIVRWLDARLPDDAILTNGAGNYSTWLHRLFRYRQFHPACPLCGIDGYVPGAGRRGESGTPGAVSSSWNGDGCFLMNGQELATAVQYRLNIIFVVVDNGMYGTIRMHQERTYPDAIRNGARQSGFCALARAYGAHGETVTHTAEFAGAFERAVSADRPALLHLSSTRRRSR